jgi:hypothetical protein
MFDKTIISVWEDNKKEYLLSFDDDGVLYLTEREIK